MAKQRGISLVTEAPPSRSLRELYFDLGRVLLYHNQPEEAEKAFERALEQKGLQPRSYDILIQMGSDYQWAGNGEAAVRAFLRAAASEPEQVDVLPLAAKPVTRDIARAITAWVEDEWLPGIERAGLTARQYTQVVLFVGKLRVTAKAKRARLNGSNEPLCSPATTSI